MFGFAGRSPASGRETPAEKSLSLQQRLSQGLQRAGAILTIVGPSPIKSLRSALLAGDEEKALSIYTSERGGKTLEEDLHPSMSFPTKKFQTDTPLHLAAEGALGKLIQIFLEHGGNPNTANGRGETCLHSICHRPENARLRLQVMDHLLLWRGAIAETGETVESVSINHVDVDGNAAVHYASSNGLLECVERLISVGAIISIVNKAQKTCCELADGDNHKELARMLELALVFQPVDSAMIEFDIEESLYFDNQNRLPMLALDCESFHLDDISILIDDMLIDFAEMSGETFNRSESLLEAYSWDINKLKKEYLRYSSSCYKLAQIQSMPVNPFEMDRGPWSPESDVLKYKELVDNIAVNDNNNDSFGITDVSSRVSIDIHKHSEEDFLKNIPGNGGDVVILRGLSAESIMLDFKSISEHEKNIDNEKSNKIIEMEGSPHHSSSLVNSIDKNRSMEKKKEERKKTIDKKSPIDQHKDDSNNKRNKSEKKCSKSGEYDTRQSPLKYPVFTSNPCSICGEMMQRPVSASNASLTRGAEQRREKEKMSEKRKLRANERDGKEKENGTRNGNQGVKDSHINSDIDGTHVPSAASSSTPTSSSLQSSSSSATYHSTSASTSLPNNHNYSEQHTKLQTQTLPQNYYENQYEYQSGDVPDLDLRTVQCLSGHSFCLACWSAYVSLQVKEQGAYSMKCPGYKCGEILDAEWAPVLLKPELVIMLKDQRLRHVVDCCPSLRWCAHDDCDQVVYQSTQQQNTLYYTLSY